MNSKHSNARLVTPLSVVKFAVGSNEITLNLGKGNVTGEDMVTREGWHILPNPNPAVVRLVVIGFSAVPEF